MVSIISNDGEILKSGVDSEKAIKALRKINIGQNALARKNLAEKLSKLPEETRIDAFNSLIEKELNQSKKGFLLTALEDLNAKLKQAGGNGYFVAADVSLLPMISCCKSYQTTRLSRMHFWLQMIFCDRV